MKTFYRKYEMLSAYIDDELSDAERKKLEEELKFSKELQEKLAELKRLKQLTTSSVKSIGENPYFETRLAAAMRIKNPWYNKLRKLSPVLGIVAVSLVLMIVLKYNPQIIDRLVEQQKSSLSAFYKENLKPLLFAADLTNEDIFNFAFYHQLPLDNQKHQYLQFGSDNNGKQYFEIRTAGLAEGKNNLEKFIKGLNLNGKQQKQMDSILASYASDLQSQVLVNEKNTVAINPNIWNYNKALTADLISFAAKVNKKEMDKVLPPGFEHYYNQKSLAQIVDKIKSSNSKKYIFFTPDSIFSEPFDFNKEEFKKEMNKWSDELAKNMNELNKNVQNFDITIHLGDNFAKLKKDSAWGKDFKVFIDSNYCRVHIPNIIIPPVILPNMGNLTIHLDSLAKFMKEYSFNIPELRKHKNFNFKYFYNDSSKGMNFNFKAFGFDSAYNFKNHNMDSLLYSRLKNHHFSFNPDSMASLYKFFMNDSTNVNQQRNLQKEMKEFQKEMENFRKEMEKLQKEFQKNTPQQESKKPVII